MSIAISWGEANSENSGMIYLDAVTQYTQNHRGQVTKHPVDTGGLISDHFIRDNPRYKITGVITNVDISTDSFLIQDPNGNLPFNTHIAPSAVSVNSTDQSVLKKFIPSSIGQFLSDSSPEITIDSARPDQLEQIRQFLIELMSGVVFNEKTSQYDPNVQLVTLYEYDGAVLNKPIRNLVMTDLSFREDANTGHGLYCDFSFEQVTFASLKKTTLPKDVSTAIKKKAESPAAKGKQDSTIKDQASGNSDAPKDTDPLRQAKEN